MNTRDKIKRRSLDNPERKELIKLRKNPSTSHQLILWILTSGDYDTQGNVTISLLE